MAKKNFIPIFNPSLFKSILIEENHGQLLDKMIINDFFIHNLSQDVVSLKLPLPPHRKTVHDFVLITKGKMVRSLGIERFEIDSGSAFFAPAGSITTTEYMSDDIDGYFCHFSDDFLATGNNQLNIHPHTDLFDILKRPLQEVPPSSMETILFLLNRILEIYKHTNNLNLIRKYLITLFAEFESFWTKGEEEARQDSLTRKFQELVIRNFKNVHAIATYAEMLNVSPNHLNKHIKSNTGNTASHFLREHLVLESKVLLYQTDLSIKEISMDLGFKDVSYFGRFFKINTGYSPSEFKKRID